MELKNENTYLYRIRGELYQKLNYLKMNNVTVQNFAALSTKVHQLEEQVKQLEKEKMELNARIQTQQQELKSSQKSNMEKDNTIAELMQKTLGSRIDSLILTRRTLDNTVVGEKLFAGDTKLKEIYLKIVNINNLYFPSLYNTLFKHFISLLFVYF